MSASSLQIAKRTDGIVTLTIDQPGSRANILTRSLWNELHAVLKEVALDSSLTGLILESGKPSVFIAGADLKYLGSVPAPNDPGVQELMEFGLATLAILANLPFPTCAVIDGAALGGGLEVALACDYRLVGSNPKVELGLPEVTLGLIPGWGGTQRLPRIIDLPTAADMMMTGKSIGSSDAIRIGLADGIVGRTEPEALFASGMHPARRAAKSNPVQEEARGTIATAPQAPAGRAVASVVAAGSALPLIEGVKRETTAFIKLAGSNDSRQRINDFFAKRKK